MKYMKKFVLLVSLGFLCMASAQAQLSRGDVFPDVKSRDLITGKLYKLSDNRVLFTILYLGNNHPKNGQSYIDANPEYYALSDSEELKPYFNNYNPDYGYSLALLSGDEIHNSKGIERKLGIGASPEIILIDHRRHILTHSKKATDIIDYITTNLSMFASTDWNGYILHALEMFEAGQVEDAQEIVSQCLALFQWADDFSPEANKAILRIVASMKDEVRRILWVNLSIKHKSGLLSDEEFAPFKDDYMLGDKDLKYAENVD